MRVPMRTTLEEELLNYLRVKAIELKVDMNDILEALAEMYKNNEIHVEVKRRRGRK